MESVPCAAANAPPAFPPVPPGPPFAPLTFPDPPVPPAPPLPPVKVALLDGSVLEAEVPTICPSPPCPPVPPGFPGVPVVPVPPNVPVELNDSANEWTVPMVSATAIAIEETRRRDEKLRGFIEPSFHELAIPHERARREHKSARFQPFLDSAGNDFSCRTARGQVKTEQISICVDLTEIPQLSGNNNPFLAPSRPNPFSRMTCLGELHCGMAGSIMHGPQGRLTSTDGSSFSRTRRNGAHMSNGASITQGGPGRFTAMGNTGAAPDGDGIRIRHALLLDHVVYHGVPHSHCHSEELPDGDGRLLGSSSR